MLNLSYVFSDKQYDHWSIGGSQDRVCIRALFIGESTCIQVPCDSKKIKKNIPMVPLHNCMDNDLEREYVHSI